MEFNSTLINMQGVLFSLENKLGTLKNIKFEDANSKIVIEAIGKFIEEASKGSEDVKRKLHFYLVLNTDFPIQEFLCEDENIAHLLNTAPTLSQELLVDIVRSCGLQTYAYEIITYCEAALSVQYLEALSTHNICLSTKNLINQSFELVSAIFLRIVRLSEGYEKCSSVNYKYLNCKLYDTLTNMILSMPLKLKGKIDSSAETSLVEITGYLTKYMIALVSKCLSSIENPCPLTWYPSLSSTTYDYTSWGKCDEIAVLTCFDFIVNECYKNMESITIELWLEWEECSGETWDKSLQTEIAEECYLCINKDSKMSAESLINLKTLLIEYKKKPFDEDDEIIVSNLSTILASINDKNKTQAIWMEALLKRDDGLSTLAALTTVKSNLDILTTDMTALLMNRAVIGNSQDDILLKQIAFEAFQRAPIIDQPKLLEDFFTDRSLNDCFKSNDFDSTITSVLNRSANLHTRRDKWLPELLLLCLQSPRSLLERMIMAGAASRGQGNQMCAALLELQPICDLKVKEAEDTTLLLHALGQAMTTINPATSQITHLVLQLEEKGLLNKVVFLKTCVLPALKRDLADYKVPHIQLWLQLLRRLLKVDSPHLIRVEEGLSLAVILAVLAEVLQRVSWVLGKFRQQESLLRADTVLLVRPLACRMANTSQTDDKELLWLRAGLLMLTSHNRSHFSSLWTHFGEPVPSMNLGALLLSRDAMCQQSSMPPGGPDQLLSPLLILLPTCCTPEWRLLASSLSSLLAFHHSAATEEEEEGEGTRTDEQMLPEVLRLLVTTLMLQALMLSQQQPDDAAFSNDCALACLENSVRNLGIVMKEEWLPRLSGLSVVEAGAGVVRQVALLLRSLPTALASSCSLALSGVLVQAQEILLVQAAPQPELATWCAHELALSLALLPDRESRQALSRKLLLEPALAQL